MVKVCIVGPEEKMWGSDNADTIKKLIKEIISGYDDPTIISGACPKGGVDKWAEEVADELCIKKEIYAPTNNRWEPDGYKERNIKMAEACDVIHVITLFCAPSTYRGFHNKPCYHCKINHIIHLLSGACYTAKMATHLGKEAHWYIIPPSTHMHVTYLGKKDKGE